MGKQKGHWPRGKRRHPEPTDWRGIMKAMDEAANHRQARLLAKKVNVHVDTVRRWRTGRDLPAPGKVKQIIAALYAMKLYRVKQGQFPPSVTSFA